MLGEWAFHESSVRNALELGSVMLLAALMVLVLWRLQGGRAPKNLYLGTLGLLGMALLYVVTKTGLLLTALLPARGVIGLLSVSV